MHMPGHKRNAALAGKCGYLSGLCALDITEIDGMDDLNDPHGLFLDSMNRAAALWHSGETLFSVNGSTAGILASVYACVPRGGTVIAARNCHRSVYNALELRDARVFYAMPETDLENGIFQSLSPAVVAHLLDKHPDASLVIVTSPTYEGVISDIAGIAAECRRRNVPLLTDEAHGAHLGFGDFPASAVQSGADISVQSLHKTLAGLTQTAVIHLSGDKVDRAVVRRALAMFQTSSPSYLLSASIDGCVRLMESDGARLYENWQHCIRLFQKRVSGLRSLRLLKKEPGIYALDPSKLVILTGRSGLSGAALQELLRRRYHIETEMAAPAYTVAMTGIGDTPENLTALADALTEIDESRGRTEPLPPLPSFSLPERKMSASEALARPRKPVPLAEAAGLVCGDYAMAYPPGVPLLVPGEQISPDALRLIGSYEARGIRVRDTSGVLPAKIFVIPAV